MIDRGPPPYPEPPVPGPEAPALAAAIAELLRGWPDRARDAGLRDLGYLLSLAEAEARHVLGQGDLDRRWPSGPALG